VQMILSFLGGRMSSISRTMVNGEETESKRLLETGAGATRLKEMKRSS